MCVMITGTVVAIARAGPAFRHHQHRPVQQCCIAVNDRARLAGLYARSNLFANPLTSVSDPGVAMVPSLSSSSSSSRVSESIKTASKQVSRVYGRHE